jgi:hypothetical protein
MSGAAEAVWPGGGVKGKCALVPREGAKGGRREGVRP